MLRLLLEFILVFIVGFAPLSGAETALVSEDSAQPVSITAEVTSQQEDGVKIARFENMLNHNYCFGTDKTADDLILSASLSLSSLISDGKISKSAVDGFVFNMYGIDMSDYSADADCYDVPPMGFDQYRHTVTDFFYNGDGTLTVTSEMSVGDDCYVCTSIFLANGESVFGYNLISSEVNW